MRTPGFQQHDAAGPAAVVCNCARASAGQALARKWRPRNFEQLVGQEHVVRALTNALRQNRLHHAYLLTGTRGVGKTTLARVMAKALNCETGITAAPCGVCGAAPKSTAAASSI